MTDDARDDTIYVHPRYGSYGFEGIRLPDDEFAMVVEALNTHLTAAEKKEFVMKKRIGKVEYTFENHGHGEYRFLERNELDE